MNYQYKMVQVPPNIEVKSKEHKGNEAAHYMEMVVNEQAQQGGEFYRVDPIGVLVSPGCLASLFGKKTDELVYYVITFRRDVE